MLVSGFPGRGYLSAATPMLVALCICVSESAENWLASQLPSMTDDQRQFFLSGHG